MFRKMKRQRRTMMTRRKRSRVELLPAPLRFLSKSKPADERA
jgi:hypothetical protein